MQWETDVKVLRAIYELEREDGDLDRAVIAERAETTDADAKWAIANFARAGHIRAIDVSDNQHKNDYIVRGIEPAGLRALQEWPSIESVAAELVAQLRDAAGNVSDPTERGVILRFVESMSAGVATAVVTKHAPWLQ